MIEFWVIVQEACEKVFVVFEVNYSHRFSDTMHGELWCTDIDCLYSCLRGNHWADSTSTKSILFDYEILDWNITLNSQLSKESWTTGIGHISLIGIYFEYYTTMDLWLMLSLMFLSIIRMNSMGHVGWDEIALVNCSVEVFLWCISFQAPEDSFSCLHKHVAICTLSWLRSYFFMVKKAYHTDIWVIFCIIFVMIY